MESTNMLKEVLLKWILSSFTKATVTSLVLLDKKIASDVSLVIFLLSGSFMDINIQLNKCSVDS